MQHQPSLPRRSLRFLWALSLGLLALTLGLIITFRQGCDSTLTTEISHPLAVVALAADSASPGSTASPPIGGKDSGLINILLIGLDRQEENGPSRSDTMVLCTFCPEEGRLITTSFLRDLYVPIPGHRPNRLNAAYAIGGMPLLRQTVEENFGILLDGCLEVDFSHFPQLVDLQGGVTIELRKDEAELLNKRFPGADLRQGSQLLTGEQALAYARIRSLDADGDFSRTGRQRKIITAFFDSCKDLRLPRVLKLVDSAMSIIGTDMKQAKLVSLALELFPTLDGLQIVSQRIPQDGTYRSGTVDGMAVLMADLDAARTFLKDSITANEDP